MPQTFRKDYVPTHPGLETAGAVTPYLNLSETEGLLFGGLPANSLSRAIGWKTLLLVQPPVAPETNASFYTATAENSGTITGGADGLVFTTGSTGGNECGLFSLVKAGNVTQATDNTLQPGDRIAGLLIAASSSTSSCGIAFGVGNTGDPIDTEPTDCIWMYKVEAAATMTGRVRGNSGTAAASSTLQTIAATLPFIWRFDAKIGDMAPTTRVTSGATNATQAVGSTVGMRPGQVVSVGSQSATILTVDSATQLTFTASITTTTGDLVVAPGPATGRTTVTTGASSATQTVGSTAGMAPGTLLYFVTTDEYRVVSSVASATSVVLDATLSTTTGETVAVGGQCTGYFAAAALDDNAPSSTITSAVFSSDQLAQMRALLKTPQTIGAFLHYSTTAAAAIALQIPYAFIGVQRRIG